MTVRRSADLGLMLTARVMPVAVILASRLEPNEHRRVRKVLECAARGEEYDDDKLFDALSEGTQGLGGLALLCAGACVIFLEGANLFGSVALYVLAAASCGGLMSFGALLSIYGMRAGWRVFIGGKRPSLYDFWVSLAVGICVGVIVLWSNLVRRGFL